MRLLFLGDIVGRTGRKAVVDALPGLRRRYALDCVVINGENAAGGFGITEAIMEELIGAGADAVTLGNHAFDQKEALVFIERYPQLVDVYCYSSDYPHSEGGVDAMQGFYRRLEPLGDEVLRKFFRSNAELILPA